MILEPIFAKLPWTADQVSSLNAFQESGIMHPFTCGGDPCRGVLVATPDGWTCPECRVYTQNWAHQFMADWSWRAGMVQTKSGLWIHQSGANHETELRDDHGSG